MAEARKTEIELTWESRDVSRFVKPYLVGMTYTDHLSGAVDDLEIELEDRDGLWSGDWRPQFGDTVEARVKATPWLSDVDDLRVGLFSHDAAVFSGPPQRLTLKAVSAALSTGLRRHRKNKRWSSVNLKEIAQDIADGASMTLFYDAPVTVKYRHREQRDQSDLEFLQQECREAGYATKITEGQIAIFDEAAREQEQPSWAIELTGGNILSWTFTDGRDDHYGRCRVSCFDPRTGKKIEGTFRDPSDEGPTLEAKRHVSTQGEAEAIAEGLLRSANSGAKAGHIVAVGDPGLVAGVVVDLRNAYGFEDRYIITKSVHRYVPGYTVALDLRRCLESY